MAEKKGKSLLGKLSDVLLEDGEEHSKTEPSAPAPAQAAPSPFPTGFGFPSAPVAPSMSSAPAAPTPMTAAPSEVDPEALQTFKQLVYVSNVSGHASNFMLFLNMWNALGHPSDPNIVLKALQVTNPNLSSQAVVADIDQHLALLDNAAQTAKMSFETMAHDTLGANDSEIAQLTKANQMALSEIERHQRETQERTQRLQALQGERAENEAKLNRGRTAAVAAETQVRSELAGMKQLFTR